MPTKANTKSRTAAIPVPITSAHGRRKKAAPDPDTRSCPICGQEDVEEWLRAPDRFHGRKQEYVLLRCRSCSVVWLWNPPRPSEMHLHYTAEYDRLISAAGENSPRRWRDRKAALAPHKSSGALLDLGCSSGAFLQSMTGQAWELYGIEMSEDSAKQAASKSGAEVFVGDILDAPFELSSFDVVTCFDVFEHLYEPLRVIRKVAEWLKPGGIFYVLVPNVDSAEGRVFGSYWHGLELPRHLFHYSPASLKALAQSAGLEAVSVETRRNSAVGTSLRYVWDDVFGTVGIRRTPVAYRGTANLAWRAMRKVTRMTVLKALLAAAPMVGGGESIHAVFKKSGVDTL